MRRFVIRRLLLISLVLFLVSLLVFVITSIIPWVRRLPRPA